MTDSSLHNAKDLFADDQPISSIEEDRLGFAGPAGAMARGILDFASPEGFVIGLEGPWGSGKSSLINLIADELKRSPNSPEIIYFSPWLISSREGLLSQLFRDLARSADKLLGQQEKTSGSYKDKLKGFGRTNDRERIGEMIEKYSGHLTLAGNAANLLGYAQIPGMRGIGDWLKNVGDKSQSLVSEKSLGERRESIKTELRKLDRQIVIFVDDLDRLQPKDVGEVVRLVKAVADFPNVVYVLSYARDILARNLEQAYSLKKDERYIDKIVQVTFSIPKPEDFALRHMFRDGVFELFPNRIAQEREGKDISSYSRLLIAIDQQGGKTLNSPRSVVRALNALRLYAGANLDNIDLADMVWLQLIRLRNPKLYDWIESYLINVGAVVNFGGRTPQSSIKKIRDNLLKIIEEDVGHTDIDETLYRYAEILPGLNKEFETDILGKNTSNDPVWQILRDITITELSSFIEKKRLGSPSHYRHYFAFTDPENAFSEEDFQEFLRDLEHDKNKALRDFDAICVAQDQNGRSKVRRILLRLEAYDVSNLSLHQMVSLCEAFAHSLDKAALISGREDWGLYREIEDGTRLLKTIFKAQPEWPEGFLQNLFGQGNALGWLSATVRSEFFAHGRHESSASREAQLSSYDLDAIIEAFVENVRRRPFSEVIQAPKLLDILFAWAQGSEDGYTQVKAWIEDNTRSDSLFLQLLLGMRSWSSGRRVYYPLRRNNIKPFIDYDVALARARTLQDPDNTDLSQMARDVVHAFEIGDD